MNLTKKEQQHNYYMAHREEKIRYAKEYILAHPEQHKTYLKTNHRLHNEKLNEYNCEVQKKKYNSNENFRLKNIIMSQHTQFLKGKIKHFEKYVGVSLQVYMAYIESMLEQGLNWIDYGKKWRLERIKTINELNLKEEKDKLIFCNYKNIKIKKINVNE